MRFFKLDVIDSVRVKVDFSNEVDKHEGEDDDTEFFLDWNDPDIDISNMEVVEDCNNVDNAFKVCIKKECYNLYEKTCEQEGGLFFGKINPVQVFVCVLNERTKVKKLCEEYLDKLYTSFKIKSCIEVSITEFFNELKFAKRNGLVDAEYFIGKIGLSDFYHMPMSHFFNDKVADDNKSFKDVQNDIKKDYLGVKYSEEISRILKCKKLTSFIGNPAHYVLFSNNSNHRKTMIRNLIVTLYKKGRLISKRYTIVNACDIEFSILENLYKVNEGASIVIRLNSEEDDDNPFQNSKTVIEDICKIIKNNGSKVLTIFSMDGYSNKIMNRLENALRGVVLVDISEGLHDRESAICILKDLAKADNFVLSEGIISDIKNSDKEYDYNTIVDIYSRWRQEYLSTNVFPEYKQFVTHVDLKSDVSTNHSDAYQELQEMIGLANVKSIINQAINYFKLQQEFKVRGIEFNRPCMHMVFTGNPGTAKTTVARLVAKIFKDNNILSKGELIEVGRGDIVGKYVGHTAPLVKSIFERAKGSVLFIDEAYSLVDDSKGLFGDEAINTIVQEMENNRDDIVVILAGYKEEMGNFIDRNPGLRSRIAFHVSFDDYDENELLSIAKVIAKKNGYKIDSNAEGKILEVFSCSKGSKSFGNGRFVRNLIDKAKFSLSNRLANKDLHFVSDVELTTLMAEDFDINVNTQPVTKSNFLGF